MPRYRNYRRRYRSRRRRRYRRNASPTYGQIGRKIYSDVAWLRKKVQLLNVEVKNHDFNQTSQTLNPMSTASAYVLNVPAQGDTAETRDGNSIKMLSQHVKYHIQHAGTGGQRARVIMFQLMASNGQTPALSEILEYGTTFESMRNLTETRRIKVLYDRIHTGSADRGNVTTGSINIPTTSHVKFSSATANTFASAEYGAIGLIFFNDQGADQGVFHIVCRTRYVDN